MKELRDLNDLLRTCSRLMSRAPMMVLGGGGGFLMREVPPCEVRSLALGPNETTQVL
jgi:hypothetical protein